MARRVATGMLWPERWVPFVTAVPEELIEEILRRCETENLEGERLDGMAAVVRIGANEALAARLFNTLRAVRAAITGAPEADQTHDYAITRQLEVLLETLPSDVAVAGMLGATARPPLALDVEVATRVLSRTARRDRDPLTLEEGHRAALREYLRASVAVVLQQEDFDGQLKADLASALAQVGHPADLADLVALINADVERARSGRAARAAGDHGPRGNGGLMSQAPWHLIAVQDLDPVGAVDVLIEQLRDPEYTWAVAEAMCRTDGARIIRDDERYRELWKAREGRRPTRVDHEQRSRYAASLAAYLLQLLDDGAEAPMFTPVQIAKALAAVDDDGRFAEVVIRAIRVAGAQQSGHCIDAAERLLANGVVLPTDETVTLVDAAWQARYQDNPDRWLVRRSLNLLPFTTDPVRGIARVRELLAAAQLAPHQCRDIIVALGESRCDAAVALLRELAERPHVLEQCSDVWLIALARLDTRAARELLLSWVDPDVPGMENAPLPRRDVLVNQLADLARRHPGIGARMLALATCDLSPMQRELVAGTLLAMGTPEALMASLQLIDDGMEPAIADSTWQHLEGSFVEQRPHPLRPNVYVMSAQAANDVRRRLFEMTQHDERRRASAFAILGKSKNGDLRLGDRRANHDIPPLSRVSRGLLRNFQYKRGCGWRRPGRGDAA